jgi:Yip1 domain
MTPLQILAALITNPRRAFTEIDKNPRFALPMILLLVANVGVIIWFYSTIDIDAFVNQTLSARGLNAAQRTAAAGFMSRNWLMGSAAIGGIIGLIVLQLIEAFYLFFIYEFLDVRKSFRQWFALTWWCSVPTLITALAAAVMIVVSHSSGSLSVLSPLSLNALFYHFDSADSGYTLLNSITLVQLLVWWLTIVGTHTWSQRSWVLNTMVVILPRVLIYGVWGWWALFR